MTFKSLCIVICFIFSVMSCNTPHTIEVQGHRGCRGLLPENSLPAFSHAIALGVHTLELDLAVSKDHKVVVSHEPFMSRLYCLDPKGKKIPVDMDLEYNLYQMAYDSIKLFDCGTKTNPKYPEQRSIHTYKPLLSEVIALGEQLNPNVKYNVELKARPEYDGYFTPVPEIFVRLVLDVVKQQGVMQRTNLQSFDLRVLEAIKKQEPNIRVALLVDADEQIGIKLNALSYKPEIISPYYKLLTKKVVKKYQDLGYRVIPWTVNEYEDLDLMISFGVDAIITDYPNRLPQFLQKRD